MQESVCQVNIERNVKLCLLEDFPVGCQFKETFGLNFPEAHRDLHERRRLNFDKD